MVDREEEKSHGSGHVGFIAQGIKKVEERERKLSYSPGSGRRMRSPPGALNNPGKILHYGVEGNAHGAKKGGKYFQIKKVDASICRQYEGV